MKKRKLEINLLASIIVLLAGLVGFGVTSFLLSTPNIHIPLGFLFSGAVVSLLYLLTHIFVRIDEKRQSTVFSLISIIMRLAVLVGVMIILGFMNYRWNMELFNIFVFIGVYTIGIIVFVVLNLLNKERKETDAEHSSN